MTRRTLIMYQDVQRVLDAAVLSGGGVFRCNSHGTAVHWRQRAYQFRKLFRDEVNGQTSKYDRLTFRKVEPESSEVIIAVIETPGEFIPANNFEPLIGVPEVDEEVDVLQAEADALASKLNIL